MSDLSLSEVIDAATPESDRLTFPAPANWKQGRTAYGGFTSALMLATARQQQGDLPSLRSAMVNFTAPVTEPPSIASRILRQGRNITTIMAEAESADALAATATFTFGRGQQSDAAKDKPAPAAPAPADLPPFNVADQIDPPIAFFENFEVRLVAGAPLFSGADTGLIRVWARHKDPLMREGSVGVLALADLLPPAVYPVLSRPAFNSSVNWLINFLSDAPRTRDGWWLVETRLTAARDGYSSQSMRLWNTDGTLVTDGMQAVIVFER